MSDLHLQDQEEPFLFNREKEAAFVRLASEVLKQPDGKLIMAGDILDLTSMIPPTRGLQEFFDELLSPAAKRFPEVIAVFRRRTLRQLIADIRSTYPDFFMSLRALTLKNKLHWIPGNHDCALQSTEGKRALCDELQIETASIQWSPTLQIGSFFISAHGHEFDAPNSTAKTCLNAGWAITSSLYCAVGPALLALGVDRTAVNAVPAVRPEEEIVIGITHYLGEEESRKLLIAFVRLLTRNGYFKNISRIPMWFLIHEVPFISGLIRKTVTPERIRKALPSEDSLIALGRKTAAIVHKKHPEAIVILGHTHALDGSSNYVNLGTWIDHIPGLRPEQIRARERSLPVLLIEDVSSKRAALYDARGMSGVKPLNTCKKLWESHG